MYLSYINSSIKAPIPQGIGAFVRGGRGGTCMVFYGVSFIDQSGGMLGKIFPYPSAVMHPHAR